MSPLEYAINNDKIINLGVEGTRMAFTTRKAAIKSAIAPLIGKLEKSKDGLCTNCRANRVIINRILLVIRRHAREARRDSVRIYDGGNRLIRDNIKNYYGEKARIA